MTNISANLFAAIQNTHIRWTIVAGVVLSLVPIWFPDYGPQCQKTLDVLILYGLAVAANSAPKG